MALSVPREEIEIEMVTRTERGPDQRRKARTSMSILLVMAGERTKMAARSVESTHSKALRTVIARSGGREGSQQPEDSGDVGSSRKTTESRALTDPSSSKSGKLSGSSTPRFDSVRGSRGPTSDTSNSNRVAQVRAKANDLSEQFRRRVEARASPPPPASPTLSEEEDIGWLLSRRNKRALAEPRSQDSPAAGSSKMDKYFEESYDPRLDVGPLSIPTVPTTGLIEGNEFERWEAMLDIIRQRREDKAERKRMERLGISKEKEKSKGTSEAWTMSEGVSVMDIKYNKRGATREWDMGKDLT